jgi:hypothetical protein
MRSEGQILARYVLSGRIPTSQVLDLYEQALQLRPITSTSQELRLQRKVLKYPFLLPYVDGALALGQSHHPLRRKIIYMTAIVEAQTNYVDLFLPRQRSKAYIIVAGWHGIRGVWRFVVGRGILLFL